MIMKDGTRGHVSLHLMCFSIPAAHIEIDQGGREVQDKQEIVGAERSENCNIAKNPAPRKPSKDHSTLSFPLYQRLPFRLLPSFPLGAGGVALTISLSAAAAGARLIEYPPSAPATISTCTP